MDGYRSCADLLVLLASNQRPKDRIVACFHLDRRSHFLDQLRSLLLPLPKERIQETGLSNIMTKFTMFEENVHRFPERVIKDLDDFLVNEQIFRRGGNSVGRTAAGK